MENKDYRVDSVKKIIESLDNFLYGIANNVTCTICHELFNEPVTLQCRHSFCSKCIKKFYATSKYGKVNCPLCRGPTNRRSGVNNPALSKIAKICAEAPAAFKEDVTKLTENVDCFLEELIKSSRISQLCEEKVKGNESKEKEQKKCKKSNTVDVQSTKSFDSLVINSVVSHNGESVDLKSVSQMGSKSETYFADSNDVEEKLRNVIRIPSTEKVESWLQNVDTAVDRALEPTHPEKDGGKKLCIEINDSKVSDSGTSMIRVDYNKSNKSNIICTDKTLTLGKEDDPYEFIASQRNTPPKRKRASRRSKTIRPQFETAMSFGKEWLKEDKGKDEKNISVFGDDGSDVVNVQKPVRTYCTRFKSMNKTSKDDVGKVEAVARGLTKPGPSNNSALLVDITDDESNITVRTGKSRARRRILSSSPESGRNVESHRYKKPKFDNDCKNDKKSCNGSKCSQSPGWSRVTHLKMDFGTVDKRKRPCRKSLNISGGELNVNTTKTNNNIEILSENDKEPRDNILSVTDLGEKSDPDVSLHNQHCEDVENAKELEQNEIRDKISVGMEVESKLSDRETKKTDNEPMRRSANQNKIPFKLLGKVQKRKRASIVFLKMGRLSPYLMNSRKTVVQLVFPPIRRHKTSVGVQIDEFAIESRTASIKADSDEAKVDVGVQTTQATSSSKEVQTYQQNGLKSVAIQTETSIESQQMFDEVNTPQEPIKDINQDDEAELNTELLCDFRKTWPATQTKVVDDVQKKETAVLDCDGSRESVHRVVSDVNLNLTEVRDMLHSLRTESENQAEKYEESDSDIFIEQTPPREGPAKGGDPSERAVENTEESFLMLSIDTQNVVPSSRNPKFESVREVENDENNQNELNRKLQDSAKDRKLCIVSSGIRNRKMVDKFVKNFKVEHSSIPKKEMTHLIVGLHENEDDELVPYCTPKFLYAIANKKWIVTEAWIEECLKKKAILPEEPFESVDPVGGNGCRIARLSNNFLLENWEIYLYGKFVTIAKEEFAELIRDCGGTIVSQLKDFSYARNKIRLILLDGSGIEEKREEYESLYKKYRALVMSRDVAIMSIQSYQMVNFTPFVEHYFSTEECVKWGYPIHLVTKDVNLEDSHSGGVTQY